MAIPGAISRRLTAASAHWKHTASALTCSGTLGREVTFEGLCRYASKCGSTKGIAASIGDRLRQKGLEADVLKVDSVNDVRGCDAFVAGNALHMFH
jgi:hypothetical protein